MPKIDAEISAGYGSFVKQRLASYIPISERPDRVVQVQEVSGEGDFEERFDEHLEQLKTYNYLYHNRIIEHKIRSALNRYRAIYFLIFFFFVLIISPTFNYFDGFTLSIISVMFFICLYGFFVQAHNDAEQAIQQGVILTSIVPYNKPTEQWLMSDCPKPILPDDIKIDYKDVAEPPLEIRDDVHFDKYQHRVLKYGTEANCPICNSLIKFSKIRKVPFEDKCESCEYTFTFIYKKRTERYKTSSFGIRGGTKEKSHYIEYDGIEPTRARSPSKSRNVSGTQRKSIPKDVKNDVWNRDDGKCVQCNSKENLEFDHIIPVAKGGANTYRNLQLLCEDCNRSKSDNIG